MIRGSSRRKWMFASVFVSSASGIGIFALAQTGESDAPKAELIPVASAPISEKARVSWPGSGVDDTPIDKPPVIDETAAWRQSLDNAFESDQGLGSSEFQTAVSDALNAAKGNLATLAALECRTSMCRAELVCKDGPSGIAHVVEALGRGPKAYPGPVMLAKSGEQGRDWNVVAYLGVPGGSLPGPFEKSSLK